VDADLTSRTAATITQSQIGFGRELFASLRTQAATAEAGGGINLLGIN